MTDKEEIRHRNQVSSRNLVSSESENKNLKIIASGARIDLLGRIYHALIRYSFVFLLARLLGAGQMGIFFLGVVIVEFVSMFARLGLETGVIKFVPMQQEPDKIKGILTSSLQIALMGAIFAAIVLWLGADFLARFFHKPDLSVVIKIIALAIPASSMMWIFISGAQAFHTMKYRSSIEFFLNPTLNILLFLLFFFWGKAIEAPCWAYVLSYFCSAAAGLLALKKLFPQLFDRTVPANFSRRRLLNFSLPMVMINILSMILLWTDTVMVGYFRSAEEVGIYSAAARTAFFVNFVLMAFTSIFAPRISELFQHNKIDELGALYKTVTRWIFSLSLPVFLIMILLGRDVLLLFGKNFSEGYLALTFLSMGYLVNASVGSVRYILTMVEKEKLALWDTISLCSLNIMLNWLLIPQFGIKGAAAATAISVTLINGLMLAQVYGSLKIQPYEKKFFKPLATGILIFAIGYFSIQWWSGQFIVMKIILATLIIVTVYFLILRILGIDEQDRAIFQALRWR